MLTTHNVTGTAAEFCRAQTSVNDSAIAVGHDNIPLVPLKVFSAPEKEKLTGPCTVKWILHTKSSTLSTIKLWFIRASSTASLTAFKC